jgi:hypothetical protein
MERRVMRLRLDVLVLAALSALVSAGTAQAQCLERLAEDAATVNRWPYPYVCPDRVATVSPFATMVANGWRRQNFMLDSHFGNDGRELNEAGQKLLYWILTQSPPQYRTVQVAQTADPKETAARVASVQKYVAKFAPEGQVPIIAAIAPPEGLRAYWPDPENTMMGRTIPVQRPMKVYVPDRFKDDRYSQAY